MGKLTGLQMGCACSESDVRGALEEQRESRYRKFVNLIGVNRADIFLKNLGRPSDPPHESTWEEGSELWDTPEWREICKQEISHEQSVQDKDMALIQELRALVRKLKAEVQRKESEILTQDHLHKEEISGLQAVAKQKDQKILVLMQASSRRSSPAFSASFPVNNFDKKLDGTDKDKASSDVMASQHNSSTSASLPVKSFDPSQQAVSEQFATLSESIARLTNEVRAYANKENSSTVADSSSQDASNQSSKTASSADWFEGINDLQMRSLLCRKDSYEFGKTKKILSWQRDISISWNAFRSEPTRWSSSFDPKYLSDPSKFDDPRTPEGPTSRTSRDILVTSKYSKPPSKSTKKNNNKNNFTNFI